MVLHVFQHYIHKKSKLSVSYIQPNPQDEIRNTTPITNLPRINFCAGAYTTGNAIEPYLTVYCADSYNGFNTIVILNCVGGAYSGYSWGIRMILDGSYNTNSGKRSYGSYIYWQSQIRANMELYTTTSPKC